MPTTPTYPGVYVEEIPSGVRTITGVATSIAAFVDYFDRGPMNRAVQLFNMGDFQREFGGLNSQSEASYAIQQFFLNGGTEAWVVRVASPDETTVPEQPAAEAQVEIDDTIPAAAAELTVTAISAGEWGNRLRARVDNTVRADNSVEDGRFELTISDYAAVDSRNVLVGQEVHRGLSMNPDDKNFVETVINDPDTGSKFVRVKANGTSTQPANPPLVNGTLSGLHEVDPTISDPPKLKVTIGHDPASGDSVTVPLSFSQDVDLSSPLRLTTIAPVLQSALRRRLPADPAFAGATVEVVGNPATGPKRLRIRAGSDDPDNRVAFANMKPSSLAQDLKLTSARASNRMTTLSGPHTDDPLIPAASPVNVTFDGHTATVALDFSDPALSIKLPANIPLTEIGPRLQDAIDSAFNGLEIYALGNRLLVLSAEGVASPVRFNNTTAEITTAQNLQLRDSDVTVRQATLSGTHTADPEIDPNNPSIVNIIAKTGAGATAATSPQLEINFPAGPVPLGEIASLLQDEIATTAVPANAAFSGVEVHAVENRLLVLSAPDATDAIGFENPTTGTQTADILKLRDSDVTVRQATLSGTHTDNPEIQAAPPINMAVDGGDPTTVALVFEDDVTLPAEIGLSEIQGALQTAIRDASTDAAFSEAIVAVVGSDRLLVLPGEEDATVEFEDTLGTTTAGVLKLTSARASNRMTTLSGEHDPAHPPIIPPDPEVDVTVDGTTFVTVAPDFSGLDSSSAEDLLAGIALRLQAAMGDPRQDGPRNPAFRKATIHVVIDESGNNRLLVLPGGVDPTTRIAFAQTSANTTADDLRLSATATDPATDNLQEYTLGDTTSNAAQLGGVEGKNGVAPDAEALLGEEAIKTGIFALEDVDLINLVCIPRIANLPEEEAQTLVSRAQTYCEKRRAFFLIDTPKGIDEPQEVKNWVAANVPRHRNAAFFYPRVKIADPLDDFRLRSVGASGTMAGLFARIDSTRGVWKAPAGTEATLVNVSQLDDVLTDQENGALNPLAINCLRNFPIYGNVAWGARTLDGSDQQASEWKYIPVRRLALFLEESLYRGIKWVVFEPNDEPLWSQIRLNVGAFMQNLFRQGAFQGQTPREAYFVKCDGETTTQNDINLGIVNILVGFAPLKPAEFVMLKIQQMAGQIET